MRFMEQDESDDPMLSVVNLIDLFLVLCVILMMLVVQNPLNPFSQDKVIVVQNPGEANMKISYKNGKEIRQYESTGKMGEGEGSKAGVTYQMSDGRMIYVPE
ncbi:MULTISPECIES: DUF2149 domain-containing protein [unclassified Acinetobacter]|jgi:hypothetical protein|uniref:DUF2149 domain-containing protein n=1 Tax=unclassified Acinetobacter TaxID=196816 RepID=UPI0015D0DCF1|nr:MULTISPECIES: DUF2149 domain-containing protein [unclassified Acinetobacter]MDD2946007.1 DUF2149 domain-containing protein [Acinetobacter sp.]